MSRQICIRANINGDIECFERNEILGKQVIVIQEESALIGLTGTIAKIDHEDSIYIGISFNQNIGGHDLDGITEYGYGYWINRDSIMLKNNNTPEQIKEYLLDSAFNKIINKELTERGYNRVLDNMKKTYGK